MPAPQVRNKKGRTNPRRGLVPRAIASLRLGRVRQALLALGEHAENRQQQYARSEKQRRVRLRRLRQGDVVETARCFKFRYSVRFLDRATAVAYTRKFAWVREGHPMRQLRR